MLTDPSQGAYDSQDDTMVGVVNESNSSVPALTINGPDIFDFDGDGLCADSNAPGGCSFGPTGYEGPGTVLNAGSAGYDSGTVSFPGGLQPGDSTYFSLEGPATSLVAQAPTVSGESAGSITQTDATISATIDPQRADTTYSVQYGTDSSYGSETSSSTVTATPSETIGGDAQPITVPISGLDPGTTYHYRVEAANTVGTTDGPDKIFTTAPALVGDLNRDGIVDCADVAILTSEEGETGADLPGDLNGDGVVNVFDLSILLSHLAPGTGPCPT